MDIHLKQLALLQTSRFVGFIPLLTVALLASCSGGNDTDTNAPSTNTAPIATAVTLSTNEDTPVNGMLNASDADGDPLTYSIVDNGTMGTAVILDPSTGDFSYTPNPGEYGTELISFKANDGKVDSNIAILTVSIIEMNNAPIASGGCSTTFQTATLFGTLSATDPDADLLMYSLNADGSGGSGPITTNMGGEVTLINPTTGEFSYQPSTVKGGKRRGKDSFAFHIRDPGGLTDNNTEEVIVNQTIMPLGDSITKGSGPSVSDSSKVGYRKPLFDQLNNSGFTFDFVGSLNNGSGFYKNHEGHSGWTANEIAWGKSGYPVDGVRAWLENNPADVILLHAGTNGTNASNDVDIESALNEIDLWEQSAQGNPVTVILALIVDKDPISAAVSAFNQNVQALANNRIANSDSIVVVNQQTALSYPSDLADSVHPNVSGYAKMAPVWFNALKDVIDKCP